MDKNEAEAVIKDTIEFASEEVKKNRRKGKRNIIITACISVVVITAVFVLGSLYNKLHLSYIPYGDTGIVCTDDEIRTTNNFAQLIAYEVTFRDENIEFLILCSSPSSRHEKPKGVTTIVDTNDIWDIIETDDGEETVSYIDKVYYLPESSINGLPFIYNAGYMPLDMDETNREDVISRLMEESTLIWER